MPNTPLLLEDIRDEFARYVKEDPWVDWRNSYLGSVMRIKGLNPEALRTAEVQQQLWSLRDLATLGPGEAVNVQGAYTDPAVVAAVAALRDTTWPENAEERAQAIQSAYDDILGLVHPAHARRRPQARLARLFAGVLPREQHCVFSWDAQRYTAKRLLGKILPPVTAAVLVRERLRSRSGPRRTSRTMCFARSSVGGCNLRTSPRTQPRPSSAPCSHRCPSRPRPRPHRC
jgi:5-methylcytosine-specific restriction protein B